MAAKDLEVIYRHARKRAVQRYGLWLTREDYQKLNLRLKAKDALFLGRESRTRTHWMIDDQFIVVFDAILGTILTFLPPEAIDNYLPLGVERLYVYERES